MIDKTNSHETAARIVYSVDKMALARDIDCPRQLDTLVGTATRALANGASEMQALEAARIKAGELLAINNANAAVDQLVARLGQQSLLTSKQAM